MISVADEIEDPEPTEKRRGKWLTTIGIALILLSGVCFFTMLSVPLFSLSAAQKGMLGGALFLGVQAFWWIGVALLGPSAINKFRSLVRRSRV